MAVFDASEIFEVAIKIEENGEKFYRYAAGIAKDEERKKIFNFLADEETNHKKVFKDMLSKIEKFEPPESYPGEYLAYLRAYVDSIIFKMKMMDKEISVINDVPTAIDFASQRELDSILYYDEIKNAVQKSGHPLIDKIIGEERKHFTTLQELKKSL